MRCHCLPRILISTVDCRPCSARNTRNINFERKAPSRGRSARGKRNNKAQMPLKTREDHWLFLALPLLPKTKDVRRSCSQRHRSVRSPAHRWADTHSVLTCTRKGTGPEMPGSVKPQLWSSMTHHKHPNVSQPREAIPHVRLSWHKPMRGLARKKRKLGPAEPNLRRVTLAQTREEIRQAHRQTPRRAG